MYYADGKSSSRTSWYLCWGRHLGYAYIGSQLGNASVIANITCELVTVPRSDSKLMFTVSLSSTSVAITGSNSTSTSGKILVIDASSNDDVSFTSNPSSSQASTGFTLFGSLLFWKSTAGQLQSSFYAAPTGTVGIWKVQWVSDPSSAGSSVTIALKKDAPGSLAITKWLISYLGRIWSGPATLAVDTMRLILLKLLYCSYIRTWFGGELFGAVVELIRD